MTNGWTGGQYSIFRALLGGWLAWRVARLLSCDAGGSVRGTLPLPDLLFLQGEPGTVTALVVAGVLLALALAAGFRDRWAAIGLGIVWACLLPHTPLASNLGNLAVGGLLLAHACLPAAPYGSFDARGRIDPRGDWAMPRRIFGAAWIALAVVYSYSGMTKLLGSPAMDATALVPALELAFAPLALVAGARSWLWLAMLVLQFSWITLADFAGVGSGVILLHLFAFDPGWVAPARDSAPARLFYDGACGLCHRTVRFVLAEDRSGDAIRFSPLQGEAFAAAVPEAVRRELPDSLVLLLADGTVLVRSRAALACAERLGGLWRVLATVGRAVPPALLDRGYDFVARIRTRLFAQPKEACPLLPPDLRQRFF